MFRTRGQCVYELLRLVRPLTLLSGRVVGATVRDRDLTVGSRAVLELLVRGGPVPVPELARLLEVSRQAVQRLVDDLRSAGYAEPRANPAHRRSVLIAATGAGEAAFVRVHDEELAHLGAMLRDVTEEDLATAVRVLAALHRDVRDRAARLGVEP